MKLDTMKLPKAAQLARESVDQALSAISFSREHRLRIRTNNPLERHMREFYRRTRIVDSFPVGQSVLKLSASHLRHVAGTRCSTRRYLDMTRLYEQQQDRPQEELMSVAVSPREFLLSLHSGSRRSPSLLANLEPFA